MRRGDYTFVCISNRTDPHEGLEHTGTEEENTALRATWIFFLKSKKLFFFGKACLGYTLQTLHPNDTSQP